MIFQILPSISMWMPFLNWLVLMDIYERIMPRTIPGGAEPSKPDALEMARQGQRPVAGYIRVSRIGGRSGDGYISPDEQRNLISSYAKELGVFIPDDAWGDD